MNIKVNTENIKNVRPVIEWQKAATDGDLVTLVRIAASVIENWDLESDPKVEDSFYDLTPEQFAEVLKKVGEQLAGLFR